MGRIALVEDHERLAQLVCKALANVGILVDAFPRIEAAWPYLRAGDYEAAVIDRGLPDGDGLDLVRRLRGAQQSLPCLLLTARDALHDRVDGLESGADDYLTKPFEMEELVARVRALTRRPAQRLDTIHSFGDIQIRPDGGMLVCAHEVITLAPAELQIMLSLLRASGKTLRRSALELSAWGLAEAVTPNALDVALHRLRRKLLAIGSVVRIVNTRGHGYALVEV
ncbi:response regulator transcription factor [Rhodoferax sp.]|uniref:response regulator transcription factor n=1 Tax=Rhodoferax sp. TaxID=50421 RepID=UPI00374DBEBD